MTESRFTAKLLRALRAHPALRDAVIWKLNDRMTRGIPDFVVTTAEGRTTWWEVKIKPNMTTKLQSFFLAKLGACAFIIRASKDGSWVDIFNANYGRGTNYRSAVEEIVELCEVGHG